MVAHAASGAGLLGRRQHSAGLVRAGGLELAGDDSAWDRTGRYPPAAGRVPAGNRFLAPHGACNVTESYAPSHTNVPAGAGYARRSDRTGARQAAAQL